MGNDYLIFALGFILVSILNLSICYLYTRPFMVAFFKVEEPLVIQPEVA
jgi:hypothetical protein